MLEIVNRNTTLVVHDYDKDGDVEIQILHSNGEEAYTYLTQDQVKKLIDHLNKQIS